MMNRQTVYSRAPAPPLAASLFKRTGPLERTALLLRSRYNVRVRRRLFNLAAAASLVLCVVTVVLLWGGIGVGDAWLVDPERSSICILLCIPWGLASVAVYARPRRAKSI
jgi:hypothetical protein